MLTKDMFRLHQKPLEVLNYFCHAVSDWVCESGWKYGSFGLLSYSLFPYETYWVCAGIMSSIGFGTGFQTGPLLLFPHVSEVASTMDNFTTPFLKILYPTLLWGVGTALGEVPPYLAAKVLISQQNINMDLQSNINKLLKKLGAFGIFLLACYPNATFDVAGIMAGISDMPFYKFLLATVSGKAFVKAPLQSSFIIWTTQQAVNHDIGMHNNPYLSFIKSIWLYIVCTIMFITSWFFVESIAEYKRKQLSLKCNN